jgi:hypothetical protein
LDAYFFGDHRDMGEWGLESRKFQSMEYAAEHVVMPSDHELVSALLADTISYTDSSQWVVKQWSVIAILRDTSGKERYRVVIGSHERVVVNGRRMKHPDWMVKDLAAMFSTRGRKIILNCYENSEY